MKLGIFDKNNLKGFSGIPERLVAALGNVPGTQLKVFDYRSDYRPSLTKRVLKKVSGSVTGKYYVWEKEPRFNLQVSRKLDKFIFNNQLDAVMLFGSEGCAYSRSQVPIYCYTDSIFGTRTDLYSDQKDMSAISVREGRLLQQLALNRASKIFISSKWALERAQSYYCYDFDETKFEVVGIGANLPDTIYELVPANLCFTDRTLDFLWIGVDWERKRGEFSTEVVRALRTKGYDARLHVIGTREYKNDVPWVIQYGLLDYKLSNDALLLAKLYHQCCGLMLPSIADITPCTIAESFAHGRPVFASNMGGIPEMLNEPDQGLVIAANSPDEWAAAISVFIEKQREHPSVSASCRSAFINSYNWNHIARRMTGIIKNDLAILGSAN